MIEPISVNLVLLLLEHGASEELGPILWAGFKEVEAFYNLGIERAKFRRFTISEPATETRDRSITSRVWDLLSARTPLGSKRKANELSKERNSWRTLTPKQRQSVEGKFSRTVDAVKVGGLVNEVLAEQRADAQVIVIDRELTPPSGWRYIIWDRQVISTVPTDPGYWGMRDHPNRIAIIKHRVRTACLSIVGGLLGLGRCANERCFLYRNVDSATRLDGMVKLGPEHARARALEGRGFEVLSVDPGAVQPIVVDPTPRRWFYES